MHNAHSSSPGPLSWSASSRAIETVQKACERGGGLVAVEGRQGAGRTSVLHNIFTHFGDDVRYVAVEQWTQDLPLTLFERLAEVTVPELHAELFPELLLTFQEADYQLGPSFIEAARQILEQWSQAGPLVVLIDDIHLADTASQQLLSYLARRVENSGIVLVMSVPTPTPKLSPDLLGLLQNPMCSRVLVTPLEPNAIAQLAHSMGIFGLDTTGVTALVEHTGGWLEYVVQTLQELPGGQWPKVPAMLPLPERIVAEVMRPFSECGQPDVWKLACALAVVEQSPDLDVLGRVAHIEDVMSAIDAAVGAGILQDGVLREAFNTDQTQLAFTHPMAAEVILRQMLPSEQRQYHLRGAEFTDNHGARLLHCAAATLTRDAVLGSELTRFADRLGRTGRWEQAARFYFAAARLLNSISQRHHQVLNGIDALASAGRITAAVPWLPTIESMPPTPAREAVLAHVALHQGQAADTHHLLNQAQKGETGDDLQAVVALRRCLDMLCRWDAEGIVTWANRAAELSKTGDVSQVEALAIRGVGLAAQGRTESADESILLASVGSVDGPQNQRFRLCAGWVGLLEGDFRTAYRELEAALPTQASGGSLRISLWAQAWLARLQFLLGDWDTALQGALDGVRRAEQAGIEIMLPLLEWTVQEIQLWRGKTSREPWRSFTGMSEMRGYPVMQIPARMIRGVECKVRNDQEGGLAALMPLIETDPWKPDHISFWTWQPELIHALVAADRLDEAAALSDEYTRNTMEAPRIVRATALASAARVAAAQKDTAGAETFYLEALRLTSQDGAATYHGRYLFAYGQMLRRAGRRKDAAARLVSAREFFTAVNATVMVAQCNQELRATGMLQHRDPEAEPSTPEITGTTSLPIQLTPQEHSIAQLVVQGLTNRETARHLFIAEKTVQYHLTRIYSKFAIRSRTELARVYGMSERHADGADWAVDPAGMDDL